MSKVTPIPTPSPLKPRKFEPVAYKPDSKIIDMRINLCRSSLNQQQHIKSTPSTPKQSTLPPHFQVPVLPTKRSSNIAFTLGSKERTLDLESQMMNNIQRKSQSTGLSPDPKLLEFIRAKTLGEKSNVKEILSLSQT